MRKIVFASPLVAMFALSACTAQPPKCSSPSVKGVLNQIVLDQLELGKELTASEIDSFTTLENARPNAHEEKLQKLSCEANLKVGSIPMIPIRYTSQLDDKGSLVVSMIPLQKKDHFPLKWELIELSKANRVSPDMLKQVLAEQRIYGAYEGRVSQAEGQLTVAPTMNGYHIAVTAFSNMCVGLMEGDATRDGNTLTARVPVDRGDCVFTAKFDGEKVSTSEKNCSYFHGALCDFSGSMKKIDQKK